MVEIGEKTFGVFEDDAPVMKFGKEGFETELGEEFDPVLSDGIGLGGGADDIVAGPAEVGLGDGMELCELLTESGLALRSM